MWLKVVYVVQSMYYLKDNTWTLHDIIKYHVLLQREHTHTDTHTQTHTQTNKVIAITLLCKIKNCIPCFFSSHLGGHSQLSATSSASASFTEDRLAASNNKEYSWSMNITICILNAYYSTHYGLHSKFSNKSMIYTVYWRPKCYRSDPYHQLCNNISPLPPPPLPPQLCIGGGGVEASCCCLYPYPPGYIATPGSLYVLYCCTTAYM